MVELLRPMPAIALLLASLASTAGAQSARQARPVDWTLSGTVSRSSVDSLDTSWLAGGLGKLRRDATDSSLGFDRLVLSLNTALAPTVFLQLDTDFTRDGDSGFDLTEAFLEWRPIPKSPSRHRVRLGGFYPRLSLENTDPGWESPYAISASAINSWIGEEVRLLGAEWTLTRRLGDAGSPHELEGFSAIFYGNDPSGTLLAWKGWGIHDRQTRWREQLPLPSLPQLQPGTRLRQNQAPHAEPFLEIDHKPGYYAGAEWRFAQRVSISAARYDNRADPLSMDDGQYGWRTLFDHIGLRAALPWNLGLIAQWMRGTTAMGPVIGAGKRVVDDDFVASFIMLTRRSNDMRVSVRIDDFKVDDRDILPNDDNNESGRAITLAYVQQLSSTLSMTVEWQRIASTRPARAYFDLPPELTEQQLRAQLRWQISSHAE